MDLIFVVFFMILVVAVWVAYNEGYHNAVQDIKNEFPDFEEYGQ